MGQPGGCWLWTGHVQNAGYGMTSFSTGSQLVHRWSFEYVMGIKIPDGMTIDHLCKNKLCVNPLHMEVVTRAENIRRAGLNGVSKISSEKTHCPSGHSYEDFGILYKNGFSKNGTVKFARRCTLCNPKYAKYK